MCSSAPADQTLTIKHIAGSDPASFLVIRQRDSKTSPPVAVISPIGFPIEGRPNSDLLRELQWYLETFLDYPFPPETEHAERVLKALRDWGEQAFRALFEDRSAGRMFDDATKDYSKLQLRISSDDPRILAWPWEALRDPDLGFLAQACQIVRQLNSVRDPQELSESLPKDRVNILLVVARPYERDVRFRTLARPLVELIEREKLPASVELLRPPTFDHLLEHLRERPGFYHILHFDGHGAYSATAPIGGYTLQGAEGKLVFETETGEPDLIPAEKLSVLLKECAVPGVVLNACQSAMTATDSNDPFASVAMALLKSGMRDVVAMAYSLYVSGAQQFLPAFYKRLFEEGSMAVAVKAGRQQMWQHDKRVCARGEFSLQDWLLPVLYQQDPLNFAFAKKAGEAVVRQSKLPEELRREKNPYGFAGRDSAILELERAMRRPPAGILIQGLAGVGKTTLAKGFLKWLDQTGGLEHEPFWFSFQEIRRAEFIFNQMGKKLLGPNFSNLPMEERIVRLTADLCERSFLVVWDNFESAVGVAGAAVATNLPASDQLLLVQFLDQLRGGRTKVLISSRSPEEWLGPQQRFLLILRGLDREERWEYCNAILHDLGKTINRHDERLVELMDLLGGHPLAMRAILPSLEKMSPGQVLSELRSDLASLKNHGNIEQEKLHATLAFVEQALPEQQRPLLTLLALHARFVDADDLNEMAKKVGPLGSRDGIDSLMHILVSAGLSRKIRSVIYEMHPLLTTYLQSASTSATRPHTQDIYARAFVEVMARVASDLALSELHSEQLRLNIHGENLRCAFAEAERLGMSSHAMVLSVGLVFFAELNRNFVVAKQLFNSLLEYHRSHKNLKGEVGVYFGLGRIALAEHDFVTAEHWYRMALNGVEQIVRPQWEAYACFKLGVIAVERRDFVVAEQWYQKSLATSQKEHDQEVTAATYHGLGMLAEQKRDFRAAEESYRKSVAINEQLSDEDGTASIYHQLGILSQKQRDFPTAEKWYQKALFIKHKQGDENGIAIGYHMMGVVSEEQGDFSAAERWYHQSLAIKEKQGDQYSVAKTYQQLGRISQSQRDLASAEQWYRKSLVIKEKRGDRYGAALSYHSLGMIAEERGELAVADQWYRKSVAIKEDQGDEHGAASTYHQLGNIALKQSDFGTARQWYKKALTIDEKNNNKHGAASAYGQLGILAGLEKKFLEGGQWLIKCILAFVATLDQESASRNFRNFMVFYSTASMQDRERLKSLWQESGLGEFPQA